MKNHLKFSNLKNDKCAHCLVMSFLARPQVEGGDGATHDLVGLCHGHIQTKQNTYLNIYNYLHKCQGCYI